jgi:hypothetical protein
MAISFQTTCARCEQRARVKQHRRSGGVTAYCRVCQNAINRAWNRTPRGRYSKQKRHAKERGIPFLLTFEQWWELWEPYWEQRGRSNASALCMARFNDQGAYEIGNVEIKSLSANTREGLAIRWRASRDEEKRHEMENA